MRVSRFNGNPDANIPSYESKGAAGMDISSCVDGVIKAGEQVRVPTGLAFEIPEGHVGFLKERSGLSWRNKLKIGAGVIDSDYRGEVQVILQNRGSEDFEYKKGDRVAQMIIIPVPQVEIEEVTIDQLNSTERGTGGFGSTGIQTKKHKREESSIEEARSVKKTRL